MVREKIEPAVFKKPDWGYYYNSQRSAQVMDGAMRVVLFGSTLGGLWVLEALRKLKFEYGENRIQLIGLATDEPRLDHSKISMNKRIWQYFEPQMRNRMVHGIINLALNESMDVFTGNIKTEFFESLLYKWKPHLIIMACFGQIVPSAIFNYPDLGMYNFHPSDLRNNIGVGPKPFEDTILQKISNTRVSLMEVTEILDQGPMVAQSPSICITDSQGMFFDNILLAEEKVTSVFPFMTNILIKKLLPLYGMKLKSNSLKIDMENEIDISVKEYLLGKLNGKHSENYPFPNLDWYNQIQSKQSSESVVRK